MIPSYNEILLSDEKEQTSETHSKVNLDESQICLLNGRSQAHYILWAPIVGCFRKGKIIGTENRSAGARGWGWEERWSEKR